MRSYSFNKQASVTDCTTDNEEIVLGFLENVNCFVETTTEMICSISCGRRGHEISKKYELPDVGWTTGSGRIILNRTYIGGSALTLGHLPEGVLIQDRDALASDLDQTLGLHIVEYLRRSLAIGSYALRQVLMRQAGNRIALLLLG